MKRIWWVSLLLPLSLFAPTDTSAQQHAVGSITGSFDVALSGSAVYSIPLQIAPGTSGVQPKISLVYDSQALGGPLGAGWAISGLTVITRGPKNARFDGVPDGIRMEDSDALYLDGERLVAIATDGTGTSRRIEYRKEIDDQTKIVETGADFGSARFVVNTKGGLQIEFDNVTGTAVDQNRGNIGFSDGSILLRAATRITDTTGNFIDFYYLVNNNGNYDIKSIRYTGHEALPGSPKEQQPYAYIDFDYEVAPRTAQTYVAGRALVVDSRLKGITARVATIPDDLIHTAWLQVSRYSFDYQERETANRYVLTTIHEFGEDNSELTATSFTYSDPVVGWANADYTFPAIFAKQQELAAGYRFAHISTTATARPDLLYATLIDGQVEAFAFENKGTSWSALSAFSPKIPFVTSDGKDLGVIIADVNGDGRADLLQSYELNGHSVVASYTAGADGWELQKGFDLPFVVSKEGNVVAKYQMERWTGGPGPDLIYQSGKQVGFLANTSTGWQKDDRYLPPFDLTNHTWVVDVDCSGKPALIGAVKDAQGHSTWRTFKFGSQGWNEIKSKSFALPFPANIDPEAVRIITVDSSGCPAVLVATAQNGGTHAVYKATSSGWEVLPSKIPPFDLVDSAGQATHAVVGKMTSSGLSDVFAHSILPNGQSIQFMYFQTATSWMMGSSDFSIPVLARPSGKDPVFFFVADFIGDGRDEIVLPSNSRESFGQFFMATNAGFIEKPNYVPPVAFAKKDHQDQGVRMVDLNGDGLADLLVSYSGNAGSAGAWINTASGWQPQPGLIPPIPFAGDNISGDPAQFVDVDGDGFVDLLYSYRGSDGVVTTKLYRNVGSDSGIRKWSDVSSDGSGLTGLIPPAEAPFAAAKIGDMGVRFADVTGTGRPYMLVGFLPGGNGAAPKLMAYKNDGATWSPAPEFAPPVPFVAQIGTTNDRSYDLSVQLVDVNGDGLPDIVAKYHDPQNPSQIVEGVWLDTGSGWKKDPSISVPVALDTLKWDAQQGLQWEKNASIQWADINGDGLPDIVYTRRDGATNYSVTYVGTGKGWTASPQWQIPIEALPDRGADSGLRIVDVNGDGYADLIFARHDPDGSIKKGLFINSGTGWIAKDGSAVPDLPFVDKDGNDLGVRLFDIDGRGLVDFVEAYLGDTNESAIKLNLARRADVIQAIDSGYGLTTKVFYQSLLEPVPSDLGNQELKLRKEFNWHRVYDPGHDPSTYPTVAPVPATYAVRRVVINNGGRSKVAFSYRYGALRMDALSKRGLGFAWRDSVSEQNGVITHTDQSQEVKNAGRTLREYTCWLNLAARNTTSPIDANPCANSGKKAFGWVVPLTRSENLWKIEEGVVGGGTLPQRTIRQISLTENTSTTYELDGHRAEWHTDAFVYDEPLTGHSLLDRHMNALRATTKWGDNSSIETVNEYSADDVSRWFLGRLTKSVVTKLPAPPKDGQKKESPQVSSAGFSYDPTTGLLASQTVNLGTSREVETSYSRDHYGNIAKEHVRANGIPDFGSTIFEYDRWHRFLISTTNPLKHTVSQAYAITSGLPTKVTDPNGAIVTYVYDGFGRIKTSKTQTGADTFLTETTEYKTLSSLDPSIPVAGVPAAYAIRRRITDGSTPLPYTTQLIDARGHVLRTITAGFSKVGDRLILRDSRFDALGQPHETSVPYDVGTAPKWAVVARDVLGRITKQTAPDGGIVRIRYSGSSQGGLIRTVRDERPHTPTTAITVTNMRGLPILVTDASLGKLTYNYDAGGKPVRVEDALGNTSTYTYDEFGNRKTVSDPDAGKWSYEYDALGHLTRQTDSDTGGTQTATFEYDALGRIKKQTTNTEVWTWEYDTAIHGLGRLALVKDDANNYLERYSYDEVGRANRVSVTIAGQTYTSSQTFDGFGRVVRTEYPDQFATVNSYDSKGFLESVSDASNLSPFWNLESMDAFGHVTSATYGNGVREENKFDSTTGLPSARIAVNRDSEKIVDLALRYDKAGDLTHREEAVQQKAEDFTYDGLDRLTGLTRANGTSEQYSYDIGGRVRIKAGVNFVYANGALNTSTNCNQTPVASHAVLKTVSTQNVRSYAYDCHGNMTSSNGDIYSYSFDNRLTRAEHNPADNYQRWVQIDYRPDGLRYRETARHGRRKLETISIGGYEKVTEFGAEIKADTPRFIRRRWYLTNGDGTFAVVEKNREEFDYIAGYDHPGATHIGGNPVDVSKTWYLHKDQQGLILAISDETGSTRAHYWYDPWGARRGVVVDPTNQPSGMRLEDSWSRGFLGQEHFQDFELIHLNGRVYDPVLAMFTSPDPLNQSPLDGQLWNPYTYSRNNPLRYIDPTGYDFWSDAWNVVSAPARWVGSGAQALGQGIAHAFGEAGKWLQQNWRQVVVVAAVVVVTVVTLGSGGPAAATLGTAILSGMAAGATAGGLSAALYGGNLNDVLTGAIKGGVIGAFSGAAFYGVGQLTAGGGLLNGVEGIAGHGAVGGLREVAYGGDFWHGFETGAIVKTSDVVIPVSDSTALNTARAAAVGGTAASVDGGDFANGAITGAFSYAFNDALHTQVPIQRESSRDPYSLDDAFSNSTQVNMGSSVGIGPKVYDVFGDPQYGFSTSCCGVGPGAGSDTVFGQTLLSPNVGLSCPAQLCSIGVGASYSNYNLTVSGSVRVLSVEGAYNSSVNFGRLYERVESSIYRLYGVPHY